MQPVLYSDLGTIDYLAAWNYQEQLMQRNLLKKSLGYDHANTAGNDGSGLNADTQHYLLLLEHPPVYTLGKSGKTANILISDAELLQRNIGFYKINRGGDITFHGPGQLVGYPVLDLERFGKDIGKYLRNLEEVIIRTLADYGLSGERSPGETGVWLDPSIKGKERKICAMDVRCSRWVTMHGFALNVNTDLSYFDHIIPCGIVNKQVTSLQKELNKSLPVDAVKEKVKRHFEDVFDVELQTC